MVNLQNNINKFLDVGNSISFGSLHIETNDKSLPSENLPELTVNVEMTRRFNIRQGRDIVAEIDELYFLYGFRCNLTFQIPNKKDIKIDMVSLDTRISIGSITQFYKNLQNMI